MSKQVLSDNLEDALETDRNASGQLPPCAPLATPRRQGSIVQEPTRRTRALDPFAEAAERDRRLGALVHASYPLLWRTLRRLGVVEAQIDDALEEVFLVALRRLDGIDEVRERGFLLGLTLRAAATRCGFVEPSRRQGEASLAEPAAPLSTPEQLTDRRRARALLDEILGGMGLKSRTVFVLLELEGLGALEIAEVLDVPLQTVGPRVRGARESFRRIAARHPLISPAPQGSAVTGLCRMLDDGASPDERWLLESAEQDVPPEDGPYLLIRTLGVDTSLARADVPGTGSAASHAGLEAVASSGGVGRAVTSKGLLATGARWLGAGLVAGAMATGALRWVSSPHASPAPVAPAAVPAQSPKDARRPAAQTLVQSAERASNPVPVSASPPIRPASVGSRTDAPRHDAKARAATAVRRRARAAPSASRGSAQPAHSKPAAPRTLRAAAAPRPSTPSASSVAAFPDG